jgi:hypothetical protein
VTPSPLRGEGWDEGLQAGKLVTKNKISPTPAVSRNFTGT